MKACILIVLTGVLSLPRQCLLCQLVQKQQHGRQGHCAVAASKHVLDEVAVGGDFRDPMLWWCRGLPDLRQHHITPNAQDPPDCFLSS